MCAHKFTFVCSESMSCFKVPSSHTNFVSRFQVRTVSDPDLTLTLFQVRSVRSRHHFCRILLEPRCMFQGSKFSQWQILQTSLLQTFLKFVAEFSNLTGVYSDLCVGYEMSGPHIILPDFVLGFWLWWMQVCVWGMKKVGMVWRKSVRRLSVRRLPSYMK